MNILFDLDGTLTDSGEGIIKGAILTLEHYHLPYNVEDLRYFVGPPLSTSFRNYGLEEEKIDEAINYYRSYYLKKGKYENKVYPGILELLKKLSHEYSLYVATSKPEDTAKEILDYFDLSKYFTHIYGSTNERSKKEDVIKALLKEIPQDQTLMIGDTYFDVEGAKALNIDTIGVTWGYGDNEAMINSGALCLVDNCDELYNKIKEYDKEVAQ